MTKDFTKLSTAGVCQAKRGLLFLRDCGAPASAVCHLCGRPVCDRHVIRDAKGPECPDCVSQARMEAGGKPPTRPGPLYRTGWRNHYYHTYGYYPIYYGHSHYYSDRDYRTLDRVDANIDSEAGADGAPGSGSESGFDAQGFDSLDGPLES